MQHHAVDTTCEARSVARRCCRKSDPSRRISGPPACGASCAPHCRLLRVTSAACGVGLILLQCDTPEAPCYLRALIDQSRCAVQQLAAAGALYERRGSAVLLR